MGKKKIIALAVFVLGAFTSLAILLNALGARSKTGLHIASNKGDNPNLDFTVTKASPFIPAPASGKEVTNLTESLARDYLQEIAKRNVDGPKVIDGKAMLTVPGEEAAAELIAKSLSKQLVFPTFERKDIKVVAGSSVEAKSIYVIALAQTFQKNFGASPPTLTETIQEWTTKGDVKPMERFALLIPGHINDLLTLAVPEAWAGLHVQNLNLWQKKLAILKAIAQADEDPVQAMLALKEVERAINEGIELQAVFRKSFEPLLSS